jgi:hypothetical protein
MVLDPLCFDDDGDQSPDAADHDSTQQEDVRWCQRPVASNKGVPLNIPTQRKETDDRPQQRRQSADESQPEKRIQ